VGWRTGSVGGQEGQKELGKLVRAPSLSVSTRFLGEDEERDLQKEKRSKEQWGFEWSEWSEGLC